MDETASKMEELSAMMKEAGVKGDLRSREDMTDMLDDYNDAEEESAVNHKRAFAPPGYAKNSHEKDDDF